MVFRAKRRGNLMRLIHFVRNDSQFHVDLFMFFNINFRVYGVGPRKVI